MLSVTVLERGRIVRGDTDDLSQAKSGGAAYRVLPRRLYDRLVRYELAQADVEGKGRIIDWRRDYGLVGQWVGVVQVPGLQLEILPKTDGHDPPEDDAEGTQTLLGRTRSNLATMLLRGGLATVRSRGVADLSVTRGTIHDRLVDAFLDRAAFELRRGLDRGYAVEEDNLLSLRGKLLVAQQVTRNAAQRHRFFCRHDVMVEATPISIRLKQACRVIIERNLPASVSVKAHDVLAMLDEVPDVPFHRGEPGPAFNRQNERFADIYQFSCMLLEGQAAELRSGGVETFSLLFDMDKVFESFIAAFVQAEVRPRLEGTVARPQGEGDQRYLLRDVASRRGALQLKPDLLIERGDQAIVIDTKWKRLEAHKPARPAREDLYQLYAYLHRYGCQRAFFLYPSADGLASRTFSALRGHAPEVSGQIGVRFVDVSRELRTREGRAALADELTAIVREGLDPAQPSVEGATG